MKTSRVLSILIMLAAFIGTSTPANSQELTVAYAGGGVTRTLKGKKLPIRTNDKLSLSDFVTIEYGGKLDLLDVKNSKRIILKSPGSGKLSELASSNKNNVAELTKSYLAYVEKQLTNKGLFSKQRQSDFATVTRSIQVEEEKSDRNLTFEERIEKKYREFYERTNRKFYAFRDECNKKYADFVRKAWAPTKTEEPEKLKKDKEIHPDEMTVDTVHTDAAFFASIGKFFKKIVKRDKKEIEAQKSTARPIEGIKEVEAKDLQIQNKDVLKYEYSDNARMPFNYFGTELSVRLDETKRLNIGELTPNNIADALERISNERMLDNLLMDCLSIKKSRNLCDWGYLQLLRIISDQFCGEGTNESTLLIGYLLNQSGYKLKYAMDPAYEHLYVFIGSKHFILGRVKFKFDDDFYYAINDYDGGDVVVCQAKFPNEQALSLFIASPQIFDDADVEERVIVSKKYPELQLRIRPNKNALDFYDSYPESIINLDEYTQWLTYAETPLSPVVKNQVYPVLKSQLEGLSDYDKVSKILNLLQTGLEYEYDNVVWGVDDRVFFPEETLSYPFCDCEDHAILFTRLVRDLVGLECCLVYYPGHMAAAVRFEETPSDAVAYIDSDTGKHFTVCDPTIKGVGCPIGTPMDMYRQAQPVLIPLEYPLPTEKD